MAFLVSNNLPLNLRFKKQISNAIHLSFSEEKELLAKSDCNYIANCGKCMNLAKRFDI